MSIESLTPWIAAIASLSGLIIGLVTALWAYTKFIVERGLLPPTQFEVECRPLGSHHDMTLLELILHLKNCGTSALIAMNIRVDVRYLDRDDVPTLGGIRAPLFGRLEFPRSLRREIERSSAPPSDDTQATESATVTADKQPVTPSQAVKTSHDAKAAKRARKKKKKKKKKKGRETRGFSVMSHDTFVQPGIDQQYAFETAVPSSTAYILVWASFEYAQSPKAIQRAMLWLSRRLGLIQFTLRHVDQAHTTERVFEL